VTSLGGPVPDSLVVVGFGATNQAVAAALVARGHRVTATDDNPGEPTLAAAGRLGIELVAAPDVTDLGRLLSGAGAVVPSPGLPDAHPVFVVAEDTGAPVLTELDLAACWDERPIAAITGTDGKTTVTTLVTDMLRAGGIAAVAAGNNDLPLVTAIDDPEPAWFVVEASSFRLGRSRGWAPRVATWLNLAPDHLDVHATHERYEAAKARIWAAQGPDDVAVGNLDDPVVRRHLARAAARQVGFSLDDPGAAYRIDGPADGRRTLMGPDGAIVAVEDLPRALPHDLANALAAAATAAAVGVPAGVIADELRRERALPHRVEHVAHFGDVDWYDDSKATVPHATLAAISGFPSVVLIAGGRNKGLDLRALTEAADRIRSVVAIGEAAWEIASAFEGIRPVDVVDSMEAAVATAALRAEPGDAVLLSPACASFDWYPNYSARGEDFANRVHALQEGS
jgi:UDP-N-acetylmuramoylalanine--D-glutamate ligase